MHTSGIDTSSNDLVLTSGAEQTVFKVLFVKFIKRVIYFQRGDDFRSCDKECPLDDSLINGIPPCQRGKCGFVPLKDCADIFIVVVFSGLAEIDGIGASSVKVGHKRTPIHSKSLQ